MTGTKTTMTSAVGDSDQARLALKAIRARSFTDPLGAMGFRKTRERIQKESSSRRMAFVAALCSFASLFGMIVATAPEQVASQIPNTTVESNVIEEVVIPASNDGELPTIIRFVSPDQSQSRIPDTRTTAS